MAQRRHSHRLAKIHRSYTVDEVARLYRVHRNTVRGWIRAGLPMIDCRRPVMVLGLDLVAFHTKRRAKNKRPCTPGQIYCVRCRTPRTPAGSRAEYRPLTPRTGNLVGICPRCGTQIYKRASLANLDSIGGELTVTMLAPTPTVEPGGGAAVISPGTDRTEVPGRAKEALRTAMLAGADPIEALAALGLVVGNATNFSGGNSGNALAATGHSAGDHGQPASMNGTRDGYHD